MRRTRHGDRAMGRRNMGAEEESKRCPLCCMSGMFLGSLNSYLISVRVIGRGLQLSGMEQVEANSVFWLCPDRHRTQDA